MATKTFTVARTVRPKNVMAAIKSIIPAAYDATDGTHISTTPNTNPVNIDIIVELAALDASSLTQSALDTALGALESIDDAKDADTSTFRTQLDAFRTATQGYISQANADITLDDAKNQIRRNARAHLKILELLEDRGFLND